ncbi:alpha-galactosidase [Nonomuraea solani]|uniref:Alpha-galactosidase n=1 Tax=Nonomuraea solani TaxID=1144553 RepID=A0A1H6EXN1_9ACTN|nr:alpha-galactosidase [Nonomuraea solani]SEH01659.1 alpha-galactosidase [Nonomuraea solani]
MPVIPLDDHQWAVITPATTYVLGVETDPRTGEATPRQTYWGPRLTPEAARQVTTVPARHVSSFATPAEIEELLPVDGGTRWGSPSLQVTFGHARSLELRFTGAQVHDEGGAQRLDLALADAHHPFEVVLSVRTHDDTDVIERWTTVRTGSEAAVTRLDSGNWFIPDAAAYRYSGVHGAWSEEMRLQRGPLPVGELTFTSRQGITSHIANPWVMIDAGEATEEHGEVWGVALAWSGSWRLTTTHRSEGGVCVSGGFGHDGLRWTLGPGEELVTPVALGLYSGGGFGAASRSWHDYARAHVLPTPFEERPVLYNSWEATTFAVTEEGQLDLAKIAASIGVELFVIDDGWFGARDDDTTSLGDWFPHRERFPDGLRGMFDGIRDLGLRTGLWVEPEGLSKESELYRAHPEWALHMEHRRRDEKRRQLVLNFARDDVRDWALGLLDRLVTELGLDYLKWDMNRPFTQAGWPERGAAQDRVWIEHTRGVYRVMESLRERHPGLRIESCAGGGGRTDFGIMRHTDEVWPSDNTDARDRQGIHHGFSQLYPAGTMSVWVTDSPNPSTRRAMPLRYRFHVAMAGVLGIGGDLSEWSTAELESAAELVERYKEVRATVQHGRQYRLAGTPGIERSAVQYVLGDEVVVLVYNPIGDGKRGPRRLRLTGLDPDALYELDGTRWHGSVLMATGIRPPAWEPIGADYRSDMVVLRRV